MTSNKWRKATVAAALLVVLAGVWGISQLNARRETERRLTANYQERFFEAVGHVDNIEVLLAKGLLLSGSPSAGSELGLSIFSDIWRQAFAAQANLTQLPLLQGTLMRTSKFLTQVGDFGYSIGRKLASGIQLKQEDQEKLAKFQKEAATLNSALRTVQAKAAGGSMPWGELQQSTNKRLGQKSKEIDDNDFVRLDKQASEFPTIIYDGPFSDHILQKTPKGITGKNISEGRAEEIALQFANDAQLPSGVIAEVIGRTEGEIPVYQVRIRRPGRNEELARIDISCQGGHVVWMLVMRKMGQATLTLEEAGRRAKDFLVANGFANVIPTYANQADAMAIIPFAPLEEGVIIYPDLLKVTVALDNGQIIGYEALGYLMQHHDRKLAKPTISAQRALQAVSSGLEVSGSPKLALIPTELLQEKLTYEIKGNFGEAFFVNYVDAQTGELIRILQILDTPEGPKAL